MLLLCLLVLCYCCHFARQLPLEKAAEALAAASLFAGVLHASVDASWKSSWARHSDVPTLAKCVRLCLPISLLACFHGPPCSRTTRTTLLGSAI